MGCRLVLMKCVLMSLSIYFISFVLVPMCIIYSIGLSKIKCGRIKIMRVGGSEDKRVQFFLVRQAAVRQHVDQDMLWYRVLVTKYEVEDSCIKDDGCKTSMWGRDLTRVKDDIRLSMRRCLQCMLSSSMVMANNIPFGRILRWLEVLFVLSFIA